MGSGSLLEFASKRARLAGKSILDSGNPWFVPLDRLRSDAQSRGKSLVSFANYDYLGLSDRPEIKKASAEALERHGAGALGSRLVGGERSMHSEFEHAVADFIGVEASLTLVSGYLTNLTIISHLLGVKDLLLIDELCHNSILAGAKNAKAELVAFRHNDLEHLESILKEKRGSFRNCLVVVEGLYSMDGDIPDLPKLLELKYQHNAWLLVDEAHSFGVLGKQGRGISDHFGEDPNDIDLIVGTLSKALVSCGGFLCARQEIIDWLRFTLSGFVYSVGLSPVITATAHAALDIIAAEPELPEQLRVVSEMFLAKARAAGLNTGPAIGRAVVPVMFGDLRSTMLASQELLKKDIYAPPIVHIGVPKDLPRIRFFLSSRHREADIDNAIAVLKEQDFQAAPAIESVF